MSEFLKETNEITKENKSIFERFLYHYVKKNENLCKKQWSATISRML